MSKLVTSRNIHLLVNSNLAKFIFSSINLLLFFSLNITAKAQTTAKPEENTPTQASLGNRDDYFRIIEEADRLYREGNIRGAQRLYNYVKPEFSSSGDNSPTLEPIIVYAPEPENNPIEEPISIESDKPLKLPELASIDTSSDLDYICSESEFGLRKKNELFLELANYSSAEELKNAQSPAINQYLQAGYNKSWLNALVELKPGSRVLLCNTRHGINNSDTQTFASLKLLTNNHPEFINAHFLLSKLCEEKPERCREFLEEEDLAHPVQIIERLARQFPNSPEILARKIAIMEQYLEDDENYYLEIAIAARQFSLFYIDSPWADYFKDKADEYTEIYQAKIRGRVEAQGIGSIVGNVGRGFLSLLTGDWRGTVANGIKAYEIFEILQQGESVTGEKLAKVEVERLRAQKFLVEDLPLQEHIQGIAGRFTPYMRRDFDYEYYIVASRERNPYSFPGGKIFITTGAIQAARTEAELAGIIANEIAHNALSHGYKSLMRSNLWRVFDNVLPYNYLIYEITTREYSRKNEEKADFLATKMLASAGYSADGLYNFAATLAEFSPVKKSSLSDELPAPAERMTYLRDLIVKSGYNRFAYEGRKEQKDMQERLNEILIGLTEPIPLPVEESPPTEVIEEDGDDAETTQLATNNSLYSNTPEVPSLEFSSNSTALYTISNWENSPEDSSNSVCKPEPDEESNEKLNEQSDEESDENEEADENEESNEKIDEEERRIFYTTLEGREGLLGRQTQNDVEISLHEIENNHDDEIKIKVTVKNCSKRIFALLDLQSRLLLMDENGKIAFVEKEESNSDSVRHEQEISAQIPNLLVCGKWPEKEQKRRSEPVEESESSLSSCPEKQEGQNEAVQITNSRELLPRELVSGEISIPGEHKQQSLLLEVSTGSRLFRIPFYPEVPTIAPEIPTNEN